MSKPPSPADLERERRLAQALRDNLRKRKGQARAGKDDASEPKSPTNDTRSGPA